MAQIHVRSIIDAPVERAWDALADFGNIHLFNPYLSGSHFMEGRGSCGVGTRRQCDLKLGGSLHERVTEWRPGESYTVEINAPSMPVTHMYTTMAVRGVGEGRCEVSMDCRYQPKYGIVGRLLDALLLRHVMRFMFRGVVAGLGRYLTAGTPTPNSPRRDNSTQEVTSMKDNFSGPDGNTDWSFGGTWPYQPRWFETPEGRMHYVDEGPREGRPVILLHGNPTWGYLYRNFIPPLVHAGFRAIVPDHLGFGRSDKPDDPELYRIPIHAARLEAFLESLNLREATVVPQDWGGPIGLAWAARHPERVRSLVILNTMAHRPPDKVKLPLPLHLFRAPGVGELLVKGLHAFVRGFLFNAGIIHRERLTPQVRAAYLAPHPSWASRTAILVFPREIPSGTEGPVSDFLDEIHRGLRALADRPVLIVWAMKDVAFTPDMLENLWLRDFPKAKVLRLEDAGHYLQEDAHERIVPAVLEFLRTGSRSE